MSTDAAALLAAWLSPSYPVGGFAYSHGLEWAVDSGAVHDAASCEAWLRTVIGQGAGRSDAILLAHAMRNPDDAELAALALALQPSAERRLESRAPGAAFAQVTAAAYPAPGLDGRPEPWPLALGRAAAAHGLPAALVLPLAVQAFAANLVSAAVRLVPLGQTDGQRVLAALMPLCRDVAAEAEAAPLDAIGGCVLLSDVASMCHETQYTRLFRS
jgi:urease accessory protein